MAPSGGTGVREVPGSLCGLCFLATAEAGIVVSVLNEQQQCVQQAPTMATKQPPWGAHAAAAAAMAAAAAGQWWVARCGTSDVAQLAHGQGQPSTRRQGHSFCR